MKICYTKHMIKAVIFDCFGVLMLDARTSYIEQHPEVAAELTELDKQADAGMIDRQDQINGYSQLTGEGYEQIEDYLLKEHQPNAQLVDLIKELKERYAIGMISNLGRSWYDALVAKEIQMLFDTTVISGEVGMVKPYPEIYKLTCERMGIRPQEAVFIDDIADNCEGARAVGMEAIHYTGFAKMEQELQQILG